MGSGDGRGNKCSPFANHADGCEFGRAAGVLRLLVAPLSVSMPPFSDADCRRGFSGFWAGRGGETVKGEVGNQKNWQVKNGPRLTIFNPRPFYGMRGKGACRFRSDFQRPQ
jgi:hypothetical protein